MIVSQIILAVTLLLACGFAGMYLLRPAWRAGIEQPKHVLQQQLQRIEDDHQLRITGGDSNES